jgi:hypothetical protein
LRNQPKAFGSSFVRQFCQTSAPRGRGSSVQLNFAQCERGFEPQSNEAKSSGLRERCAGTLLSPREILRFDGTNIWVTNYGSNSVTELSLSGAVLGTHAMGTNPFGIAFDGAHMWVANHGSNSVTELNLSGGVLGTFQVGPDPISVAFDGAHIWVANQSFSLPSGSVSKL